MVIVAGRTFTSRDNSSLVSGLGTIMTIVIEFNKYWHHVKETLYILVYVMVVSDNNYNNMMYIRYVSYNYAFLIVFISPSPMINSSSWS